VHVGLTLVECRDAQRSRADLGAPEPRPRKRPVLRRRLVEPGGVLSYAHTLSVECRGCACNYVGDGSEAGDERCREQYRAASVWLLNRIFRRVTAKLGALSLNDQSNPQTVIPEGMFDAQLRTPITGIRKCDCTGIPAIGIAGSIQQRM
jgi:hypothetical protein